MSLVPHCLCRGSFTYPNCDADGNGNCHHYTLPSHNSLQEPPTQIEDLRAAPLLTEREVLDEFHKLQDGKKVAVLQTALSCMESQNSRSRATCIAMGMGYTLIFDDAGNSTYSKSI